MTINDDTSRVVIQAHKLRSRLAATALIHGDRLPTARPRTVALVVWSAVIALLILAGILLAGVVIDLLAHRWR